MKRILKTLALCLVPLAAGAPLASVAQTLTANMARDGALTRLDTGDQSRGWEGVGRLNIGGKGFCTGALIADNLVLTAAHCLFDKRTGTRVDHTQIEFLAGWRNGRAAAYRMVKRAVVHPDYRYSATVSSERVVRDVALLELEQPIRNTTVVPFITDSRPRKGDRIGIVSYAHDRSEAASLQEICGVMGRQQGVLVMSCDVDFGSSGAPVFSFEHGEPRIVSVVSAKAEVDGVRVALGTQLELPLEVLRAELAAGHGYGNDPAPRRSRVIVGGGRVSSGAKFIRPGG